jgi:GMP synthase-like glutamine amidotransferase
MTSRIWFIKNASHEGPGLFSFFAERNRIPYSVVDLHKGEKFPTVAKGDVAVILGGPDSANDRNQKILDEVDALGALLKEGIPCLGICLGLQLLVKAAGGTVYRNPVKEIGFRDPDGQWFEVEKTEAGKKDPLLSGISDAFKVFQLHGETVELTEAMTRIGQGRFCMNQIVRVREKVYGIQGHVELDKALLEDWLAADGDLRKTNTVKLKNDLSLVRIELERSCEIIFKNFLRISGVLM